MRSLAATTCTSSRKRAARSAVRPMRPSPLMPILIMWKPPSAPAPIRSAAARRFVDGPQRGTNIRPPPSDSSASLIANRANGGRLLPVTTSSLWILVAPGSGLLNLAGAWEVFSHANDVLGRRAYDLRVFGPVGPSITTGHGLRSEERRVGKDSIAQ